MSADAIPAWLDAIARKWTAALDGAGLIAAPTDPGLPIARLGAAFALEPAVGDLIELLTAVEAHADLAHRVADRVGGTGVPFGLAAALVPTLTPAMLAAMAPARLFEIIVTDDAPRALARLRLSEPVFDRLIGQGTFDPFLDAALRPIETPPEPLPGLGQALATRGRDGLSPLVVLPSRTADEAAAGLAALGLKPVRLDAAALPDTPQARARWSRLWARDAALEGAALIVAAPDDPSSAAILAGVIDPLLGHVVMTGGMPGGAFGRGVRIAGGATPDPAARWRRAFDLAVDDPLAPALEAMARRFRLDSATLDGLAAELGPALAAQSATQASATLWRAAARAIPAGRVPGVRMVEPAVAWDDIVLTAPLEATLRRIVSHVRHAHRVMVDWGFGKTGRGAGVAVLFSGPSGAGKTMAAEVLAAAVDLRMMLIDISQITSKYIGETSKNVAAAFAEAERTGAVMVWNEGDAIWGSRGTVGSATDRHVNAEVGDLLQRIEDFTGFTIVTTNIKSAIDPAFLRRFRFVADFPLPGATEREAIWRRVFPAATPVEIGDAEWTLLASVAMSGGAIRNAALGAAFAAAAGDTPVRLPMIAEEIAAELRKTGQPMPVLALPRAAA